MRICHAALLLPLLAVFAAAQTVPPGFDVSTENSVADSGYIAQNSAPPSAAVVLHKPIPPVTAQDGALTLNIAVTDANGRAVAGLAGSDFTVFDNGQPVPFTGFRAPGANGTDRIILVIDAVNQPFSQTAYVRDQVVKFLRQAGGTLGVPVSIQLLTDSGVQQVAASTTDSAQLAAAVSSNAGPLRAISRSAGFYGAEDRLGISLHGLEQLAENEADRPGHKLMIWISPGWPLLDLPNQFYTRNDQRTMFGAVVALTTRLQRSDITVYHVNAQSAAESADLRNTLYESFLKPVAAERSSAFGNLGLPVFAVHSGGLAFQPTNDLTSYIATAAADADRTYSLEITPQRGTERPVFHKLEVKVNRPGVKVRTAFGYYALP